MIRLNSNKEMITGLVGENPSTYSKSRIMWNFCFEKLKISCEYIPWDIAAEELDERLEEIVSNKKLVGFNITNPYKINAMHFIENFGTIDSSAIVAGGINTYVAKTKYGYSTDGFGALKSITEKGYEVKNKNILVLGCGGAAKAIIVEAIAQGSIVSVANRTYEKAEELKEDVKKALNMDITALHLLDESGKNKSKEVLDALSIADIVINTIDSEKKLKVPLFSLEELSRTKKTCVLMDAVYGHESFLNNYFRELMRNVVMGEYMLVYQAVLAFELMFKDRISNYKRETIEKYMKYAIENLFFDASDKDIKELANAYKN
jgi:shikimate dehydrogenase